MAPQNREKEETELKQLPNNTIPICTPPQSIPAPPPPARSSKASDPAARRTEEESRTSSGNSPEKVDLPAAAENRKRPREVTRCSGSGCRKRVGLMGFRCRCGDVFCSEHRYSDRHECGYDYKAAGREAIQRENPVVKAVKLVKV